jgi:peptidoglycan/xylan/chitin deacetylase (PgdA/CDA1 family)
MPTQWRNFALSLGLLGSFVYAQGNQIAITIDDLPFVGSGTSTQSNLKRTQDRFMAIVNTLTENQVPATGFIIAGAISKSEWPLLETFRNSGLTLGNHTYSHKSLNGVSAEKYIKDVDKADSILSSVMTEPKYFRYPYLAESSGDKKQQVLNYLHEHNYTVAPVTVDSKDYEFNAQFYRIPYRQRPVRLAQFKKRYLAFIWQQTLKAERKAQKANKAEPYKQVLLIHANLLNSLCLNDIIKMYKEHGYTFISLEDALKGDTAPVINDSVSSAGEQKEGGTEHLNEH